ncbi:MAG: ABC transporter transmembrane domain-containing protein [Pseudohongiella sp.]|nr:ABC transporter transmembrane domain-containing protein [Pseudohongiella sp.]MDO9519040.1 ABC transporter transmembrane domain-containing protein [Pseudohongiella sp.]MDP2129045.1 ABC transporter transmembrane domain-containing protein [Pseudohongiella sp.]
MSEANTITGDTPAKSPPSPSPWKTLSQVIPFVKPYTRQMIVATLALLFTAAITLGLVQYARIIVDAGFVAGSAQSLGQAVLAFLVVSVLQALGTFARFYWVSWLGERVTADIRKAVFNHLLQMHPSYFEENISGEIQSRITTDTTLLQTVIGSSASVALRSFLLVLGGIVFLFITNPRLTSVVLICIPLVIGPIAFFGRRVRKQSRRTQDQIANVGAYVGESLHQIKTVQAYNHQDEDQRLFSGHVESAFQVSLTQIRSRSLMIALVMTLVFAALAVMIWVGGQDVISGRMSAGELTAFVVYAVMVASSVGAISQVIGDLQRAAGATERLMELLQAETRIKAPESVLHLPRPVRGELVLRDVFFNYPSRPEQAALNALMLEIPAGSSLALVGPSGAGKSTVFELLLRFYDPRAGEILIDGVDIRHLDPLELRQQMALVSQQPALFTGTVMENIRYGRPDASDADVMAAAEAAFASEFIESLPDTWNSHLGESGIRLSGGQKQRLAIARAILKDPRILLLDEATSALDAESERKVQLAIEKLMPGRTTIIIAHRLATVRNVDRIAVMEKGCVIALGKHEELMLNNELYARLAALQFNQTSRSDGTAA